MKRYQVKVIEKHTDIVFVDAESRLEAMNNAPAKAECEFACLYDCEIIGEEEIKDCDQR